MAMYMYRLRISLDISKYINSELKSENIHKHIKQQIIKLEQMCSKFLCL